MALEWSVEHFFVYFFIVIYGLSSKNLGEKVGSSSIGVRKIAIFGQKRDEARRKKWGKRSVLEGFLPESFLKANDEK